MDARRFDRNADQLSQILWHFTRLDKENGNAWTDELHEMLNLSEQALKLNDKLGQAAQQGLI